MFRIHPIRNCIRHILYFIILLVLFQSACSGPKKPDPRELLRGLPQELIHHLISNNDSTLTQYSLDVGFVVLSDLKRELNKRMRRQYIEGNEEKAALLKTYNKRIARILAIEYDYQEYLDRVIYIENLSPEIRRLVIRREEEFYSFRDDLKTTTKEKLERYVQFYKFFKKHDDLIFIAMCEYELALVYKTKGNPEKQIKYLRLACSNFAESGLHQMTGPVLGELGNYFENAGKIDSMFVCYEEAKKIAHRSRLPFETAHINSLYAAYYSRKGRLSLAHDLLINAMEICRQFKGEYAELQYISDAMTFQADLGCWEIVNRLMSRARVLQSKYKNQSKEYAKLYSLHVDRVYGRLLMAQGNAADAQTVFRETREKIDNLNLPYTREAEKAKLFHFWARGLLDNNKPDDAIRIIQEGIKYSQEADMPEFTARFALLLAKAQFQIEDTEACKLALQRFDSFATDKGQFLQHEWIEREALQGKLRLNEGNRHAAVLLLEKGLTRLRNSVTFMEASVQSYMWIDKHKILRHLLFDLTLDDPELGYGGELVWRDFYRLLGIQDRGTNPQVPSNSTQEQSEVASLAKLNNITLKTLRERAGFLKTRIQKHGAIHCLYSIRDNRIWRWTASPAGIRLAALDISAAETKTLVTETWEMMAPRYGDPVITPDSVLKHNLRKLARLLLPGEVLPGADTRVGDLLLITTESFLRQIPFETFDVGTDGDYVPLLLHRDVAYLRHAGVPSSRANTEPGVILVNAKPSKELQRRYPFHQELIEVFSEGEAVAALNPKAGFFTGDNATKSNLLSVWEDASFIYLAAHTLRDPQIPYLMLVPMSTPGELFVPEDAYLDFADIRAADFQRCGLVVLSGCSSGMPYVGTYTVGPSLGDAFLDAGAGAVVQTFWDVKDDEAREFMTVYVRSWGQPETSNIQKLCNTKRRMILSEGIQHLSKWGAYSIQIGSF